MRQKDYFDRMLHNYAEAWRRDPRGPYAGQLRRQLHSYYEDATRLAGKLDHCEEHLHNAQNTLAILFADNAALRAAVHTLTGTKVPKEK